MVYSWLIHKLSPFLGCPPGSTFLEQHSGHLADLVMLLNRTYMEQECVIFCNPIGSRCCPILWSEKQRRIVLDKACDKNANAASASSLYGGWITCKISKYAALYSSSKINL